MCTVHFPTKLSEAYEHTLYGLSAHCAINLIDQYVILRLWKLNYIIHDT